MKFVRCADLVVGERAKNHQVTEDEDGSGVVLLYFSRFETKTDNVVSEIGT